MRTRLLASLLVILTLCGLPLAAQETPDMVSPEAFSARTDQAFVLLDEGKLDEAEVVLRDLNALLLQDNSYETLLAQRANLGYARYFYAVQDYDNTETYAAFVATALDNPEFGDHELRVQALILDGIALYWLDRMQEADPILLSGLEGTFNRPELDQWNHLAAYYVARSMTDLGNPDAALYRSYFLTRATAEDKFVGASQIAYIRYAGIDADRGKGLNAEDLLARGQELLKAVDETPDFNATDRAYYNGFVGLLAAEAGDYDLAIKHFLEHQDYLTKAEDFGHDFYYNVQRLAMTYSIKGEAETAHEYLGGMVTFADENQAEAYYRFMLLRDFAVFCDDLGKTAQAQDSRRRAYAALREVARTNHPELAELAPLIDLNDPGAKDWAFAGELGGGTDQIDLSLALDGNEIVEAIFSGRYLALEARFAQLESDPKSRSTEFFLNRALMNGLLGFFDDAVRDLKIARDFARKKQSRVKPDATIFLLVDGIASVWGAQHDLRRMYLLSQDLEAREPRMTPEERDISLALRIIVQFHIGQTDKMPALADLWIENRTQIAAPDATWALLSGVTFLEYSYSTIGTDRLEPLYQDIAQRLDKRPDLPVMASYLRMAKLFNDPTLVSSDATITQLGIDLANMADRLPANHPVISTGQFYMASRNRDLGYYDKAVEWFESAAKTMAGNPYHSPDILAFVLSTEADAISFSGDDVRALALAKEAYRQVAFHGDRKELASSVLLTYTTILGRLQGNTSVSADLLLQHIEDTEFFDYLVPIEQSRLLRSYGNALRDSGRVDEALDIYQIAMDKIPSDDFMDWSRDRSIMFFEWSIAALAGKDRLLAYRMIKDSNDLLRSADLAASGATADEIKYRAAIEAKVGWSLANSLGQ